MAWYLFGRLFLLARSTRITTPSKGVKNVEAEHV